jgi:hypothetical protein
MLLREGLRPGARLRGSEGVRRSAGVRGPEGMRRPAGVRGPEGVRCSAGMRPGSGGLPEALCPGLPEATGLCGSPCGLREARLLPDEALPSAEVQVLLRQACLRSC